ncbi:NAD(P)-dependent oxidoreductase [Enterococcus sp.]|uniref:NAD(P)-dependent oxidoreductase n=1 Tax=Enterococcus sp. TaxID=35783 RepID=UPI00289BFC1F|nr:NAD(P)-dependent oxidoreductase [Enterococcus sp.]
MNILIAGNIPYIDELIISLKMIISDCNVIVQKNELDLYKHDCNPSDIEIVICNNFFLKNDLKKFSNLKYIQFLSSGLNNVDLDYLREKNIIFNKVNTSYAQPIAEFVVFSILFFLKDAYFFIRNLREKEWSKNRDISDLSNKKIFILGNGNIAKKIVLLLRNFHPEIFIVVRNKSEKISNGCINVNEFDTFIDINDKKFISENADIVISCLPVNRQTRHYIDFDFLLKMNDEAILINISRGEIIDEKSLIYFLEKGKFKGIYLDVFENEPLSKNSKLWTFDNIFITPHNSFISTNNSDRLLTEIKENFESYIRSLEK